MAKYHYPEMNNCVLVKRHIILLIYKSIPFVLMMLLWLLWMWYIIYQPVMDNIYYVLLIFSTSLFYMWFLAFILRYIKYKWSLIIIHKDQIILISYWLVLKEDIEIIDAFRVVKFDAFSHWIWSNMIWYWKLKIEQQREEARIVNFIPAPFKMLKFLKMQKDYILEQKKLSKIDDLENIDKKNKEIN